MDDLSKVQPIDGYVKRMLEGIVEKYQIQVKDINNPTRGERLEAALAAQNEADGFYSMELMVGRRVSSDDPKDESLIMLLFMNRMAPSDPRTFYAGFAHQYSPHAPTEAYEVPKSQPKKTKRKK
jgi:hypothetical protein